MVLGTTAHSCTFHSEGYRWLEPTTDPHAQRLSEICAGRGTGVFGTDSGASCSGENVDDGYFHMDLSQFGIEFPFMGKSRLLLASGLHSSKSASNAVRSGRSEHEVFISGNGCKLKTIPHSVTRVSAVVAARRYLLLRRPDGRLWPELEPRDDDDPFRRRQA